MDHEDTRLDPEVLLAQGVWMRRLAAALAGGDGEDLVQETWLRILTRPVAHVERPRAWLAAALRNAARMRARGEERRARREERTAREESEPSTDELVARAELEQLAVRAVLDLGAPYREALLLRYVRELEPSEIARRLDVPASTVRNRIARGLELVRARLDAQHGGDRRAWAALLGPALRVGATLTGGAFLSAKWMLAGTAVTAVLALLWFIRPAGERDGGAQPLAAEPPPVELQAPPEGGKERAEIGRDAPSADVRVALVAPERAGLSAAPTALVVEVTWHDGTPAAGVPIEVTSNDAEPFASTRAGTTDGAGSVRFDDLLPGQQYIDPLRGGERFVSLARGEVQTVQLALPAAVDVDCRVVDADGLGVSSADVWLSSYGNDSLGSVLGQTDARGYFFARDVGAARNLAARAAGFAPSAQRPVSGNPGQRLEITLALGGIGSALEGVVRDPLGAPIAGAELQFGAEYPQSVRLESGETLGGPPPVRLHADEVGRFAARGLEARDLAVAVRARGHAPLQTSVSLTAGETAHQEFTLVPEARVAGVVRDEAGAPQAGVWITGGAQYFDFTGSETRSRADGTFVLAGLREGTCLVGAQDDARGRARATLVVRAGEQTRWDPVLSAGDRVAGMVQDERGLALEGWHVAAVERGEFGLWLRSAYTDASGRFELVNCPRQPFVLAVRAPEEVFGDPVLVFDDFQLGDGALVLRVRDADRPTSSITGRVVSSDGARLVQPQVVYVSALTGMSLSVFPDEQGRFQIGPLHPGQYELLVEDKEPGRLRTPPFTLAANEKKDVGTLELEKAGRILVHLRPPAGVAAPANVSSSLFARGEIADDIAYEGLEGRSEPLGRGTYVLRTRCGEWYAPEREVEVQPGATTEVELALQPATSRGLELLVSAGDPAAHVHVVVRDEHGVVASEFADVMRYEDRFLLSLGGLLPGSYALEARTDTGRVALGSFTVLDLAPVRDPIELTLR